MFISKDEEATDVCGHARALLAGRRTVTTILREPDTILRLCDGINMNLRYSTLRLRQHIQHRAHTEKVEYC